MLIGRRPEIGAAPVSARAAATCETGNPPHATRYVPTHGSCWSRYGLPNATTIGFLPRDTSVWTKLVNASGAFALTASQLCPTYDPTITTSAESAAANRRG